MGSVFNEKCLGPEYVWGWGLLRSIDMHQCEKVPGARLEGGTRGRERRGALLMHAWFKTFTRLV